MSWFPRKELLIGYASSNANFKIAETYTQIILHNRKALFRKKKKRKRKHLTQRVNKGRRINAQGKTIHAKKFNPFGCQNRKIANL